MTRMELADESLRRIDFLGIPFDSLTMEEVLARLAGRPPEAPFEFVTTPNVDHVVKLLDEQQADWREAHSGAALRLCDSRILVALAKMHGIGLPLVPGSDLTVRLFREVIRAGDRIALVGSSEAGLAILRRDYPGVEFIQHVPPMGLRRNPAAVAAAADFVIACRARFTFVAIGAPQQEMVATEVVRRGGAVGIGLCVGASIDFLTGEDQRAPLALQRLHLEWAYRLLSNPRRMWRRYLIEGPRIFAISAKWRKQA